MMGFVFNLIFWTADKEKVTLGLILGAPAVPCLLLLTSLWFCPESPRYVRTHDLHYDLASLNTTRALIDLPSTSTSTSNLTTAN